MRRNNGTGIFSPPVPLLGPLRVSENFELGDVDNDGDLDFVGYAHDPVSLQGADVWLNNGTGTFVPAGRIDHNEGGDYALGDVDGDGDLDLVNAGVRLNDGHGDFYGAGLVDPSHVGYNTRACVLADVDGDGDLDLFTGSDATNQVVRYLNDGTGVFTAPVAFGSQAQFDFLVRDMDGDGDVDVLLDSANGSIVWANNGSGGFAAVPATGLSNEHPFAVGDVDGGGDPEALAYSPLAGGRILFNNGQGVLGAGAALAMDNITQAAFGDVDGAT